jgi:hypothetical protein
VAARGRPEYVVDFPTLGYLAADWVAAHCIVPDGFAKGASYEMSDWQLWCTCNHYRVRKDATFDPERPRVSTAFHYRRSLVVAPQKTGKGPWLASIIAFEGRGPSVFIGFAQGGETYECADHGCDCGWTYTYEPGEPMGTLRPTPLIQLTATAKEQTANVYRPLKAMFRGGQLQVEQTRAGEEFIRLPDDGRIDTVTSSAKSKLGNPVTFVGWDETGLYTKSNGMQDVYDTQQRGLAGMDARGIETTNQWDPSQNSVAQQTFEAAPELGDVFVFYREPPKSLSYRNKDDRRRVHRFVYEGSWWVNLDAIEALAVELLVKGETAQAERFFGNRGVAGSGVWLDPEAYEAQVKPGERVRPGEMVTLGFDGSSGTERKDVTADATVLRGCRVSDGFRFTVGVWYAPGVGPWRPPRAGVMLAVRAAFRRYRVLRMYGDPPGWQTQLNELREEFGERVVTDWWTNRDTPMAAALEALHTDILSGLSFQDDNPIVAEHFANARRDVRRAAGDVEGRRERVLVKKEHPMSPLKIDAVLADALAYEARGDVLAAGEHHEESTQEYAEYYGRR